MIKRKILMTLVILITMILGTMTVNVKADTQDYIVKRYSWGTNTEIPVSQHGDGPLVFQLKNTTLTGTCIQIGTEVDDDGKGKAEITTIANTSKYAKIAYYWGVKQGYQDDVSKFKYRILYRAMQYVRSDDAADQVMEKIESWSDDHQEQFWTVINSLNNITVPSTFHIYKGNPTNGDQEFAVWNFDPPTATKEYGGTIGAGGSKVRLGQDITYKISWTNAGGTITIKDTLSAGLAFSSWPSICSPSGQTLTCTSSDNSGNITYKARVNAVGITVCNNATTSTAFNTFTLSRLCNPVPEFKASKTYDGNTPGAGGKAVAKGTIMRYKISWTEGNGAVGIVDEVDEGLEIVDNSFSSSKCSKTSARKMTCTGLTDVNGNITYQVRVLNSAAGKKVCNRAKATAGLESKTLTQLCNFVPNKDYATESIGKGNIEVEKGKNITYSIKYGNTTSSQTTATITDTLSKGLTYISGDFPLKAGYPHVNTDGTTTLVWERTLAPNATEELKYVVQTNGEATMVKNHANIKYGNDTAINLDEIKNSVPTKDYAENTPNGRNNIEVKKGKNIGYSIKYGNATTTSQTAVITDTLSKGLKYERGSSIINRRHIEPDSVTEKTDGTTVLVWERTLDPNTNEEITYEATATGEATLVQNDANIEYEGRSKIELDEIKNSVPTKTYSKDTPNGKDNIEVRKNDIIEYSIKYGNATSGEESIRIVDTLSAGLEYIEGSAVLKSADGETPLEPIDVDTDDITGETIIVWATTLGSQKQVNLTYRAKVTGAITLVNNNANIKYNERPLIDLAILKNPVPTKVYSPLTVSGMNGYLVKKNDIIKYRIKYANAYDTPEKIIIIDTLSKGLKYKEGTAQVGETPLEPIDVKTDSTTGATTITWEKDNVAPGAIEELEYDVIVTGETVRVKNDARIKYKDRNEYFLNELHNPVPKKDYSEQTPSGLDGFTIKKNDEIEYEIVYSNVFSEDKEAIIVDTLSKGLKYEKDSAKVNGVPIETKVRENHDGTTTLTWKKTIGPNGEDHIVYRVKATGETIKVNNNAYMNYNNGLNIKIGELHNPLPKKEYAKDTKKGKDGEVVKKGDEIKYSIKFANTYDEETNVLVTDVLSDGLEYVEGSAMINGEKREPTVTPSDDGITMLIWDEATQPNEDKEITYTVKVTGKQVVVENNATIKYGGRRETNLDVLKNPVPKKEYSEYTQAGKDGSAVGARSRIKYSIKYANVHDKKHIEIITDTISRGLEYVRKSARIGKEKVEPTIKKNKDGTTTLTWKREVAANTIEELTYDVLVTGATTKVKNNAKITYDHNVVMHLQELRNPVPRKTYAKDTKAGASGRIVKKNDIIKYSIKYSNLKEKNSNVKIMDQLSKGLEYVKGSAKVNGNKLDPISVTDNPNGTTLVWVKEIAKGKDEELTYEVKVTGTKKLVENNATIQYDNDPIIALDELRNPLLIDSKEVRVPDTGSQLAIAAVVAGIAFVSSGGYLMYKRYKTA